MLAFRDADLSTRVPAEQLELAKMQVEIYWSLPWYIALLGAVERAAAISFHISAAVLVFQVFRRRKIFWLFLAIGWHTLLDAVAVFGMQTWGMYVTEALIVGLGILSVLIVFLLREPGATPDAETPARVEIPRMEIKPLKPSLENLEDSRYD